MFLTSMADARLARWQHHVGGHTDGQPAIGVVDFSLISECLDIAFCPADVALRGEAGVRAAVEDCARTLFLPRRQAHGQHVAELHALDVALLDVCPHPQIVRVDHRHHGLACVTTSPGCAARMSTMPSTGEWISVYASRTSALARCAVAAACCWRCLG